MQWIAGPVNCGRLARPCVRGRSLPCGTLRLWREDLRTGGVAHGASGAGAQAHPPADRILIHSRFSKNKRFQSAWCGLKNLFPLYLWEQMSRANRVRLVTSKSSVRSVRSPFVRRLLSAASLGPRQARFCLTLIRSPRNWAAPARYSPSSGVQSKARARSAEGYSHSPGT